MNKIKKYILEHDLFLNFIAQLYYAFFLISLRYQVKGHNNKINKARNVILRKGLIAINGNNNKIIISNSCRFRNVKFEINGNNNIIVIGDKVAFYERGYFLIEGDNCVIEIGENSTFGEVEIFTGESKTKVRIGKECMFSRRIKISTSDFHSIIDNKTGKRINYPKSIVIGNHVWVGNSAFISKGSIIGENSIIASRAFLSGKEYCNNSIIGGLPARVIKENVTWTREKL